MWHWVIKFKNGDDFSSFGPVIRNKPHFPMHGISSSSHDDGNKFNYHNVFFGRTLGDGQC
jgi:hypothetical protein